MRVDYDGKLYVDGWWECNDLQEMLKDYRDAKRINQRYKEEGLRASRFRPKFR
jgi:hypothetical protein